MLSAVELLEGLVLPRLSHPALRRGRVRPAQMNRVEQLDPQKRVLPEEPKQHFTELDFLHEDDHSRILLSVELLENTPFQGEQLLVRCFFVHLGQVAFTKKNNFLVRKTLKRRPS